MGIFEPSHCPQPTRLACQEGPELLEGALEHLRQRRVLRRRLRQPGRLGRAGALLAAGERRLRRKCLPLLPWRRRRRCARELQLWRPRRRRAGPRRPQRQRAHCSTAAARAAETAGAPSAAAVGASAAAACGSRRRPCRSCAPRPARSCGRHLHAAHDDDLIIIIVIINHRAPPALRPAARRPAAARAAAVARAAAAVARAAAAVARAAAAAAAVARAAARATPEIYIWVGARPSGRRRHRPSSFQPVVLVVLVAGALGCALCALARDLLYQVDLHTLLPRQHRRGLGLCIGQAAEGLGQPPPPS
jgi:hypothetical protein